MKDYIVERKLKEKKQREQAILRAARKVFTQKGFENATMQEIARRARLSKAALYLYFPSKEDLYIEIVCDVFQHFFQFSQQNIDEDAPPDRILYCFGKNLLQYAQQHWELYILVAHFNFAKVAATAEKSRVEKLNAMLLEYIQKGIEVVERGKKEKVFRPNIRSIFPILSLWVSINGAILQWHFGKPTFIDPEIELEEFVEFLLNSLIDGFRYKK